MKTSDDGYGPQTITKRIHRRASVAILVFLFEAQGDDTNSKDDREEDKDEEHVEDGEGEKSCPAECAQNYVYQGLL